MTILELPDDSAAAILCRYFDFTLDEVANIGAMFLFLEAARIHGDIAWHYYTNLGDNSYHIDLLLSKDRTVVHISDNELIVCMQSAVKYIVSLNPVGERA